MNSSARRRRQPCRARPTSSWRSLRRAASRCEFHRPPYADSDLTSERSNGSSRGSERCSPGSWPKWVVINAKTVAPMDKSFLVRLFGFGATLIHGDTLVLDRWLWLARRLPRTRNGERLIDVGCGTGAFTIGAARRGYSSLGLSWDKRNQQVAAERARLCNTPTAEFLTLDLRELDSRDELIGCFDIAICLETIEHILDDRKLFIDIARCLKPGGRILLTTPHYYYKSITSGDEGPFEPVETGWHVRRGYTRAMLEELCTQSGLVPEVFTYCSGFFSQKITWLLRILTRVHPLLAWSATLPLRPIAPLFDPLITRMFNWPCYTICLEAYKPRYGAEST